MDNSRLRAILEGNTGEPSVNRMTICRICLCSNLKLYDINTIGLSDVFNTFIDVPEWCSDKLPKYICVYCRTMLLKCVDFKSKCRRICSYFYEGNWERGENNDQLKSEVMKFSISEAVIVDCAPEEDIIPARNDFVAFMLDPVAVKAEKYENYDVEDRIDIGEKEIDVKAISTDFEPMFVDQINIKNEEAKVFKGESDKGKIDTTKTDTAINSLNELIDNDKLENHIRNSISDAFEKISAEDVVNKTDTKNRKAKDNNKKTKKTQTVNPKSRSKVNKSTKKKAPTALDDNDCTKKGVNDDDGTNMNDNDNFDDNADFDNDNDDLLTIESDEVTKTIKSDAKGRKMKKTQVTKKTESKNKKPYVRLVKPKKNKYNQKFEEDFLQFSTLYEVDVIFLSKEEQLERVRRRKEDLEKGLRKYRFNCDICYKEFASVAAYDKHNRAHNMNRGEYECDVCHVRFSKKSHCQSHTRRHRVEFKCRICNAICNIAFLAKSHYLANHGGKKFDCQHCSKRFNALSTKFNHVREQHSTVTCDVCEETLQGSIALNKHKKLMHGASRAVRCPTCGIVFQNSTAYDRHRPDDKCDVTSGRLYCGVCGDSFENEDDLRFHEDMGHQRNAFQCRECLDIFYSERALAVHWNRMHMTNSNTRYDRQDAIKKEKSEKRADSDAMIFMCEVCGRSYDQSIKLKYHMMTHTGEKPYKCTLCNKSFRVAAQLREHNNTHTGNKPFKCDLCPEAFRSYARRYQHKTLAHRDRRHMCSLCGKAFKQKQHLVAHMLTHTREKPYACNLCEKRYRCATSLKEHTDTTHLGLPHRRMRKRIQNSRAVSSAGVSNEGE